MMKIDAFDFVIVDIFSQLVKIDDQWRSIVFTSERWSSQSEIMK
jgi:hypothetical protein